MITVTLQQIKNASPCPDGWAKVLKANGGTNADMDKPFSLSSILDSNGLNDTLWVIENVKELSEHSDIWHEFARWCAMQNIEKIKPYCSQDDYELIVEWLETGNSELRVKAGSAAESAESAAESAESAAESAAWSAESAAESAAWSAARSAAWSAESAAWSAESAAWSAARSAESAARSAAWSAAESAQTKKLRELLENTK